MRKAKQFITLFLCFVLIMAATAPASVVRAASDTVKGEGTMLSANDSVISVTTDLADGTEIVRIPSYETYESSTSKVTEGTVSGGKAQFDRYTVDGFDKIYEKFCFVSGGAVVAGPLYVTEIASLNDYARPETTSIKGLQVQTVDDAQKLGVQHAALNYNVGSLFFTEKPAAEDTYIPFTSNGKEYYISKSYTESMDASIKTLSDNGMEVTLIVLLWGWQGGSLGSVPADLVHPGYQEALKKGMKDPIGRIAAVNTTNQAGIEYWIAAIEFMAERYTRADEAYGRAVNFVIGNEVNSQVVWNCMGETPFDKYADEYARTFRLAYNAIIKQYANANVMISLDHCWNTVAFGSTYSDNYQYEGKALLDEFAELQKQWGDIGWNVAYHPYPENLFEPDFWNDTSATDDMHTTLKITFKNIELLPQYLKQEHLLHNGQARHIMLTEQGFHTPDPDSLESQKLQAAAYAYAYYKLHHLEEIDAFIMHRHIDMSDTGEDGLKLGLWTNLEGTSVSPATKKYIYDVFKYIDTDRSAAVTEFALEILGVKSWEELIPGFDIESLDAGTAEFGIRGESGTEIKPEIMLSDFETDNDGWVIADYATDAVVSSKKAFTGSSALQVSFSASDYYGGGLAEKGVVKEFDTPLQLSGSNYTFVYAINAPSGYMTNATLTTTVRFYSGRNVAQAVVRITPDEWNTIRVNLSNWEYKDSIDKIKIWIETNTVGLYNGKFLLDSVGFEKGEEIVEPTVPGTSAPITTDPVTPPPAPNSGLIGGIIAAVVVAAAVVAVVIIKKKKKADQ